MPEEEEVVSTRRGEGILSGVKFDDNADLSEPLKASLKELGYVYMTQIQAHAIPKLLGGRDVLGAAKTGSGKTLAFVVPALDLLWRVKASAKQGTVVLILGPTRELVLQISEVVEELGKNVQHTFGVLMGGCNRKEEARKLAKGVNLLVATPGRLLDHLENTREFVYKNLSMLVLDEADRMLDIGFERELSKILSIIPKDRQTCLFSATQTTKVADLIRMSLKKPVLVQVKDTQGIATVAGLKQYYVICEPEDRLALLYKVLKEKSKVTIATTKKPKTPSQDEEPEGETVGEETGGETVGRNLKIMVFFSSCQSCEYHECLFRLFSSILPISSLHGKKKQSKRVEVYNNFLRSSSGVLFCTNVAARGLDFPNVDYIIQYDPPDDVNEYIHRVGRTARGEGGSGSSLLFLLATEINYLSYLKKESNVVPVRLSCHYKSLGKIQDQILNLIDKTPELKAHAVQAFKSHLLSYQSHSLKDVFEVEKLDLSKIAKAFALSTIPKLDLTTSKKKRRTK